MAVVKQQIYCTFPKERIGQPILYNLGQVYDVIPNIRGASINDDIGLVYLELEGEREEVDKAVAYLQENRVQCEVIPEGAPRPKI